ncbi:hypothetical protein DY218_13465 [Streptomyces triticagri]|uniref:Uncharacterized protein n=1 Tax=Streptomyces triticagri TaxID=2293568 RepID=A0A372M5B5_9ACTN|nr:hypothetical protein [Streptomyces triticagri]RFU86132.1 hypothetical protein DY218_13465 [Streptomyces triticagri]
MHAQSPPPASPPPPPPPPSGRRTAVLRRVVRHEAAALRSLLLWVARRRDGVGPGDHAAGYTAPQTAMLYGLLFVAVVETVALAVLVPWPVVHAILLVVDVYTVVQVVALHASCVSRPHVVGADGSLRVRNGALFDVRIRAESVVHARVERRYPGGGTLSLDDDGVLDVVVGGQTTVRVELAGPVRFVRPLGRVGHARAVRFNADDPEALVAALRRERTAPSPPPAQPA